MNKVITGLICAIVILVGIITAVVISKPNESKEQVKEETQLGRMKIF